MTALTLFAVYGAIGAVVAMLILLLFITNPGAAIQLKRINDEQRKHWHMWAAMFMFIVLVLVTWPYWLVTYLERFMKR